MYKLLLMLIVVLIIGVGSVVAFDEPSDLELDEVDMEEKIEYFADIRLNAEDVNLEEVIDELMVMHSGILELEDIDTWQDLKERLEEANVILDIDLLLNNIEAFELLELKGPMDQYELMYKDLILMTDQGENLYEGLKNDAVVEDLKEILEFEDEDINIILDEIKAKLKEVRAMPLENKIYVQGKRLDFDDTTSPVIQNGRALLPLRAVSESLDADVNWDRDDGTVTIQREQKTILLTINEKAVTLTDGDSQREEMLDIPAQIMDDRAMVPLRFVSEILDENVTWYENTGEISIESH